MSPSPVYHPQKDEDGRPVLIESPSLSTPLGAWTDPHAIATLSVTDGGILPETLNGIPLTDFPAPRTNAEWLPYNTRFNLQEPPRPVDPARRNTSGCVVLESDGRVWLVHPSNRYADTQTTFPKGRWEKGLTLLANAVKETWEESGLWVRPVSYLCDIVRTQSITRYYVARRIGGTPRAAGWESQAVSLVPLCALATLLNRRNDRKVLPYLSRYLECLKASSRG